MEPVKLDFIYGGNTAEEGPKIEQSLDDISAAAKKSQADVEKNIAAQRDVIKQIGTDIKDIESKLKTAAPGSAKQELRQELGYAKRALEEEKAALDEVSQSAAKTADKTVQLRTRIMNMKDELSEMEMAGKRGTAEYAAMSAELGQLNDQYRDTAQQITILADDQKGFRAATQMASGFAGAMTAGVGAMSLFGAENEELQKIQTRLQSVMAITIGLQQVSETLDKDSYFSVVLLNKAKTAYAAVNLKVATTLGISTAAAKAFTIAITGGLIIAVTAIIAVASHLISKQQEAAKATKELANKTAELASEPLVAVKRLSSEWSSLGNNLNEKEKYILQNQKAFKELGIEINNVADAEALLSDPTRLKAFQDSLMAKAKAAAAMEIATEKYKEAFKKQNEVDQMADEVTKTVYHASGMSGVAGTSSTMTVSNSAKKKAQEETKEMFASGDDFFKIVDEQNKIAADKLKESGVTAVDTLVAGSIEAIEAAISLRQAALEKVTNRSDYNKIDAEIKRLEKQKEAITGTGQEKAKKEAYDSETAISDLLADVRAKRMKLELDQQADSLQKRLSAIKLERDAEVKGIEEKEASIVSAYNKSHKSDKGFTAKTSLSQIDPELAKQLADEKLNITKSYGQKEVNETKKYQDALLQDYLSYEAERATINEKYEKDRLALIESKKMEGADLQKIDSAIAQADEYNAADNAAIDKAIAEKEDSFRYFVDKITTMGLDELLSSLQEANAAMQQSGASDDDKAILRAKIAALTEQLRSVKTNGGRDTEADVISNAGLKKSQQTVDVLQQVGSEIENVISGFEGMDDETKVALQAASNITSAVLASITGIITLSKVGSEAIKGVERASVILGIIGAAISVVTTAIGLFKSAAEKRANEAAAVAAAEKEAYLGILDYNEELRKRYEWTKKIGELTLAYIKRTSAELASQKSANEGEQEELFNRLSTATYKDGKEMEGYLTWNLAWREREVDKWSSLAGKSYEEIAELSAKGLLSEDAEGYFQALVKAKEEGAEISDLLDEQTLKWKELATGTTQEAIVDSIVQGFMAGKKSAADFATTFEDLMAGAMQNALSEKLNSRAQSWYDDFYEKSKDGLTDAERTQLKSSYDQMIADTAADKARLEEVSGVSMSDDTYSQSGIQGDISNMTEETGSALAGQVTAMRLNVSALLLNSKSSLDKIGAVLTTLEAIKTNTDRLNRIDETLNYMKINGIKVL
jgi:hypothetical protein